MDRLKNKEIDISADWMTVRPDKYLDRWADRKTDEPTNWSTN
jgi:hypothetical protein